jgi:hypothetical protein
MPPVDQTVFDRGCVAGHVKPRQGLMPDLPGEQAGDEQVVDGLHCLITQQAPGMVLKPTPGQPL